MSCVTRCAVLPCCSGHTGRHTAQRPSMRGDHSSRVTGPWATWSYVRGSITREPRDHAGVDAATRRDMRHVTPQDLADKPGLFASLRYPDYCLLWGATACGQAAAWALVVLRAALVYELTRSNAWVGFITMAAQLPSLVVTPFAGLLAERCDRRRVLA